MSRARPGSVPGAVIRIGSVKVGGLPAEGGELAGAGDRDDAGWLAAALTQVLPALVEPLRCSPGDRDQASVLAVLAAGEWLADPRWLALALLGPANS